MTQAIKVFYKQHDLFPAGLGDNLPAVSTWAEKQGEAVARLVSGIAFQLIGLQWFCCRIFQVITYFFKSWPMKKIWDKMQKHGLNVFTILL
jgi:hypothetical protein